MPRTPTLIRPHLKGMLDALENNDVPSLGVPFPWPIGDWLRPRGSDADPLEDDRFVDPPFVNVRVFPSAGDFDGPISDTQVDIEIRFQIQSVGLSQTQAVQVLDLTREIYANKANVIVTNRRVMDLKLMTTSGGASRDDDLPSPVYYAFDIYELWTTPS